MAKRTYVEIVTRDGSTHRVTDRQSFRKTEELTGILRLGGSHQRVLDYHVTWSPTDAAVYLKTTPEIVPVWTQPWFRSDRLTQLAKLDWVFTKLHPTHPMAPAILKAIKLERKMWRAC